MTFRLFVSTAFLLFFALACAGCSSLFGRFDVKQTPLAASVKERLAGVNSDLLTFKGLGRISFRENGVKKKFRMAFMAAAPDRLRVDVLPIPGNPGASFSTDGRFFYILDKTGSGRFLVQEASGANLREIISVDITFADMISLMSGRPPFKAHDAAVLKENSLSGNGKLALVKGWGRTVEKIWFSNNGYRVTGVEQFNSMGKLVWRAELSGFTPDSSTPKQLVVTDAEKRRVAIEVDRFWANPRIKEDGFVLPHP